MDRLKKILVVLFVAAVLALEIALAAYKLIASYGFFDWGLSRLADAAPFL